MPQFKGDFALLLHAEANPTEFLRDRDAEEPELFHVIDDVCGHFVVLFHMVFRWHQAVANETMNAFFEKLKSVLVQRHGNS